MLVDKRENVSKAYFKKMKKKPPFPALTVSKNSISSGNKGRALFRTKQNLSLTISDEYIR